ncbi:MAG: hypothetical protein PUG48_10175 [Clostridia bacterium]|nr:hypothetical protein [Clostridia bacterium]
MGFVAVWGIYFSEVPHEKVSVYAAFSNFGALLAFFEYFSLYSILFFIFFLYYKLKRSAPYLNILFKKHSIYAVFRYIRRFKEVPQISKEVPQILKEVPQISKEMPQILKEVPQKLRHF